MKLYHATNYKNLKSIMKDGLIPGCDGITYFATTETDAAKFPYVRMIRDIAIIEVEIDEDEVEEQFDHSESFFKCKAFGYDRPISPDNFLGIERYTFE